VAEVVEQHVGLRGLQPVHLGDDQLVAALGRAVQHGRVVVAEAVVVVVKAVDLAEPNVDRVLLVVPVRGDRAWKALRSTGGWLGRCRTRRGAGSWSFERLLR